MRFVATEHLSAGMVIAEDVGVRPKRTPVPLVRKNTRLTPFMIAKLRQRGIAFVPIRDSLAPDPASPEPSPIKIKPEYLHVPKARPAVSPELQESAVTNLSELFDLALVGGEIHPSSQIVRQLDSVVEQLVDSLDRRSMVNINDLKDHDEYTYHHSLSVAVLAIAIGQHMGLSHRDLHGLGKAAMMHDIGKLFVPIGILNKPSRLDESEFLLMRSHSTYGFDYLARNGLGDESVRQGVLSHHEKVDGTGYPNRISGSSIPLWGRILTVADVFDALTSNRPYRTPMQPADGLEYVMGGVGSAFDYDVVHSFLQKVEPYPVSSCVRLSGGVLAVVLDTGYQLRPVVRNLMNGEVYDMFSDARMLDVVIERIVPPEELKLFLPEF